MAEALPSRASQGTIALDKPICGAKSKRTGQPCQRPPTPGRRRCRFHGGHAKRGAASDNYGIARRNGPARPSKHAPGTYSKFIPTHLATDYKKAQADPERLSLHHEIAFWTSQEQQFLKQMHADAGTAWPALQDAWSTLIASHQAMQTAQAQQDIPGMRKAYTALTQAIQQGDKAIALASTYYGILDKIREAHELLMKLRAQEHKRLLEVQQVWTSDRVLLIYGLWWDHLQQSAIRMIPPEHVRPFLNDFQACIRTLEAELTSPA